MQQSAGQIGGRGAITFEPPAARRIPVEFDGDRLSESVAARSPAPGQDLSRELADQCVAIGEPAPTQRRRRKMLPREPLKLFDRRRDEKGLKQAPIGGGESTDIIWLGHTRTIGEKNPNFAALRAVARLRAGKALRRNRAPGL